MRNKWLLPFANALCLIHCVGMGLLSASAPIWLSGLHMEWLEYGLVIFNLVVGVKVFQSLPLPRYRIHILVMGLTVSFISLLFEQHSVYHWSVAFTAIYQIITLIQFHNKKNHLDCTCAHHEQQIKPKTSLLKSWRKPEVVQFKANLKDTKLFVPDEKN